MLHDDREIVMRNKSLSRVIGGATLTAVFSSACCWLPVLLLTFGASSAGIGGFFESYRPHLLVATALLLGSAFYIVYFRQGPCCQGEACATPTSTSRRLTKTLLWITTAFVFGFALFPTYVATLLGNQDSRPGLVEKSSLTKLAVEVDGMTCEACAIHTQANLRSLQGVRSATVSYDDQRATVFVDHSVTEDEIRQSIEAAGNRVRTIKTTADAKHPKKE